MSAMNPTMRSKWIIRVAFGLLAALVVQADNEMVIDIGRGKIRGTLDRTILSDKTYYSFTGIPYAKAIEASSRFTTAQPPEQWSGVYDATVQGSECVYFCMMRQKIVGNDDCLFVNVYTPEPRMDARRAVMVWIHGGGFKAGSSDRDVYGPDYLLEQDVVVVTFNYRLGPFGFLSTGDSAAPGNVGMKDQVAALRWVKENIQHFGGCPERITIFGQSSGAAAVEYHMMSPMSQGLFKHAISQSGSASNPWALNTNPRQSAFKLGEKLGIKTSDSADLVKQLMEIPSAKIVEAAMDLDMSLNAMNGHFYNFVPSVEPATSDDVFLPATPWELITAGKIADVPYITGLNLNESLYMKMALEHAEDLNKNFVVFVPDDLNVTEMSEREQIGESIRKFYFGDQPLTKTSVQEFTEMSMDIVYTWGVEMPLRIMNSYRSTPIFNYLFAHEAPFGMMKSIFNIQEGVIHGDDIGYLFYIRALRSKPEAGSVEEKVIRLLTKLWTNFAKTGNPTSSLDGDVNANWEPFGLERNYAIIDQSLTMDQDLLGDRLSFWIPLYKDALRGYENLF